MHIVVSCELARPGSRGGIHSRADWRDTPVERFATMLTWDRGSLSPTIAFMLPIGFGFEHYVLLC